VTRRTGERAGRSPVALALPRYAREWLRSEVEWPVIRQVEGALSPATASLHERHVRLYLAPFLGTLG